MAQAGPYGNASAKDAWLRLALGLQREIDLAFARVGKALEAYQRRLSPAPGRFDRFVSALVEGDEATANDLLSDDEVLGLRLFLDPARTQCLRCHNGALLTNQSFHHVATATGTAGPDFGRFLGAQAVLLDPFNCLGAFSDAARDECAEIRFMNTAEVAHTMGQFKTPTLRGLAKTAPYMHDGRFATLAEVVEHYRNPPSERGSELTPLAITDEEAAALVAFLGTLGSDIGSDPRWTSAPQPPRAGQSPGPRQDGGA